MRGSKTGRPAWLVDSGATHHLCPSPDAFLSISPSYLQSIVLADGSSVPVTGMGPVTIETSKGALTISECHLVPSLAQSILSVPAITEKGGKVTFEGNRCLITPSTHEQPFCVAFKQQNDCFYLSPSQHSGSALRLHGDTPGKSAAPLTLWHQRLGDAGWQLLSSYLGKTPPHGVSH